MATTQNKYDGSHPEVSIPQIGTQIEEIKSAMANTSTCVFPVGSILMFNDATNPNELWEGTTWVEIGSNCYLVGKGTHTVGTSGGSNTRTITTNELPSHSHTEGEHLHNMPHGHTFTAPTISGTGTHGHTITLKYKDGDAGGTGKDRITSAGSLKTTNTASTSGTDGGHSHTISGGSVGNYSGTTGYNSGNGTGSTGGGQPLNIEPAYYSVAIWTRTE